MFAKKLISCIFILLLPLLINPAVVSASGTEEVVPLQSNTIGNTIPLIFPSEMGPIAAGAYHTCTLTSTGGVMCWGAALLGNNSTIGSLTPVQVSGLASGVSAIAAGGGQTCALTTAGGMKCWGDNDDGQLGNNSTTDSPVPVDVSGLSSGVSAIAAGVYHTCALTTTGGVKCWGYNFYGQLGNNSTTDSPVPVDVSGLSSGVSAIATGAYHSCALTTTGIVKCWGFNTSGQLGVELITRILTPVNVNGLPSAVSAIAAGGGHTCALTTTGGVMCWGNNSNGELGNNSPVLYTHIPVNVNGLSSEVSAIATGYSSHTCALTSYGAAKCWGNNDRGELGNNSTEYHIHIPVDVSGLSSGVKAITTGLYHTCALTTSGGMKCWGDNSGGQLGNNSYIGSHIPVDVYGIGTPTTIFADVPSTYWANSFIERLYNAGITGGCSASPLGYCPEQSVTRAQMAIFLERGMHGSSYVPPAVGSTTGFNDVLTNYWAAAWIKQLAADGITGGCGAGNYCPDDPVTRAQMAVFLLKAKYGSSYIPPAIGGTTGFNDVPTNYWSAAWIKQLAAEGITGGCGTNLYCPESPVTRAQMAVFLVKTFNLP